MTYSDRFQVPVSLAVKSNLTAWCCQNSPNCGLNALTVQTLWTWPVCNHEHWRHHFGQLCSCLWTRMSNNNTVKQQQLCIAGVNMSHVHRFTKITPVFMGHGPCSWPVKSWYSTSFCYWPRLSSSLVSVLQPVYFISHVSVSTSTVHNSGSLPPSALCLKSVCPLVILYLDHFLSHEFCHEPWNEPLSNTSYILHFSILHPPCLSLTSLHSAHQDPPLQLSFPHCTPSHPCSR